MFGGNSPCGGADPMGLWWDSEIPFSTFNNNDDSEASPCRVNTALGTAVVDESVAGAFRNAVQAAVDGGYDGAMNSDGRTTQEQQHEYETRGPGKKAAPPGQSAHEAGLAADFQWRNAGGGRDALQAAMNERREAGGRSAAACTIFSMSLSIRR